MRATYDPKAKALYVTFRDDPPHNWTMSFLPAVNVDYGRDEAGNQFVRGIEVLLDCELEILDGQSEQQDGTEAANLRDVRRAVPSRDVQGTYRDATP